MNELMWFMIGFGTCYLTLNAFIAFGVGYRMWKELGDEIKGEK